MPIINNGLPPQISDRIARRNKLQSENEERRHRWWLSNEGEIIDPKNEEHRQQLFENVWQTCDRIEINMSGRRRQNYLYAMMYNDIDTNLYAAQAGNNNASGGESSSYSKITLNVVQNCVDTAASIIATNRPRPRLMADTGSVKDTIKAEQLTSYVQGVIDDIKFYDLAERVFTDAAVYGTGAIKFFIDEDAKKVRAEWVWLNEILIDDLDGAHELPTQMHQSKFIDRDRLLELYPEYAEKIATCENRLRGSVAQRTMSDEILVRESWHLPSGKKAKDGLHCITINNCTLFVERYKKDYFPIMFWRWYHQTVGFWGRGIAQEIGKIQRVINKLARVIDQAQELLGVPVIISPKTAMIAEDHIMNNEIGHWIEYFGEQGPQFLTPPAIQAELYQHLWALEQRAYNYVGINQGMAQGTKDPGVKSGSAMREANDIAAGRMQKVGQRWEQWFTDITQVIIDMSKDLYKTDSELSVIAENQNGIIRLKWEDVDMEMDRFKIKVFEVSALPSTPQGKMDLISEFGNMIPKPVAMSLLGLDPALEDYLSLETSTYDLVRSTIAKIKESDKYPPELKPINEQDLELTINIATMEKVVAKKQGVSDDTLELLDAYLDDAKYLLQKQKESLAQQQLQLAPPPMAPPGMPQAGPPMMPPPQAGPQPIAAPPPNGMVKPS